MKEIGVSTSLGVERALRFVALVAAALVAATPALAANVGLPETKVAPLSQAHFWFDQALALDTGANGAPDAEAAFAAMRKAAEAGHPQAAFNVAAMLDSGRGATRDPAKAAVWYARAAARGVRRAAFNLGQLYENGEGVAANPDLARAWYGASGLPAAREKLAQIRPVSQRPSRLAPPEPLYPMNGSAVDASSGGVDLVWTSALGSQMVEYFVELRSVDVETSREIWNGFVEVSSLRLPMPSSTASLAWRVTAIARASGDYATSPWSIVSLGL